MKLKKIILSHTAVCVLLSACAYNSPKLSGKQMLGPDNLSSPRGPSSELAEENPEISFEKLMESSDPSKEVLGDLDRLKSLYMRSEAGLSDFDKELDDSVASSNSMSFENSKSYKKMIIIWGINHKLQDKIVYQYSKLFEMSQDSELNAAKRKKAKKTLLKFEKKLSSNDVADKFSFDELKESIEMEKSKLLGKTDKSFSIKAIPPSSDSKNYEKVLLLRKNRTKFQLMGKAEQIKNDDLNQEIETMADHLEIIDQKGREPQQANLKYFPSTTTNGNVMGLIFPKNVWALTYDDGPDPKYTPQVVANLNELGIKATFFWLAENVIKYQSVVDLVRSNNLPTENHSWSHAQLTKVSDDQLVKEIVKSTEVETKAYGGERPRFFRCPYGAGTNVPRIRKMIADNNMIHVFWNVDTLDWQDKDPDSIVARAQKQMKAAGHGVVLFHDVHPQSVVASKKLVEWSKTLKGTEDEIRWVSLPEIVDELNGDKK